MHHSPFFRVAAAFSLGAMIIDETTNHLAVGPGTPAPQPIPALAP